MLQTFKQFWKGDARYENSLENGFSFKLSCFFQHKAFIPKTGKWRFKSEFYFSSNKSYLE
jgi:hypothetical protein